ncbi:Putative uncharacterized protein [Moritella viscosa]|uniref:PA14 domain-containing protein n=1 Tax=Moritella viscosa TaxID=80854 RepID=A0A1K9Z5S5_9GAMM|nr:Putative uncharacterized protein [Moritella viscosa]
MNTNTESALNEAIQAAKSDPNCVDGCVIDIRETGHISLSSALNKVTDFNHPIWLLGNSTSTTTIDAGSKDQHLFVDNSKDGFFALQAVTLSSGYVKGGDATDGAGGGLGAGGAMFVNNGMVIIEHAAVTGSKAEKGTSQGNAGSGGRYNDQPGGNGSSGGGMNSNAKYRPVDSIPGAAGIGAGPCWDDDGCNATKRQFGKLGGFGTGGGSAGGGGGSHSDAADEGGNGGGGGAGGFGGGGGGDDDTFGGDDPGAGGPAGAGGSGGGKEGKGGNTGSTNGGAGGSGGSGTALGGGIFVRGDNGAKLIVNNASFSGNSADNSANAIFDWNGSAGTSKDNNATDYNNSQLTLSLSVVNLDGVDQTRFVEGERANLVINITGSVGSKGIPVYLYLSDLASLAEKGTGNIAQDSNTDFAWNGSNLIKIELPAEQTEKYYVNLPNAKGTNELGVYSGIQLYLDKVLEGDESFTVSLLAGPDYQLANDNISQTIIIEDANYQVELLQDAAMNHTVICDAADALEQRAQVPEVDCKSGGRVSRIDVNDLKGLGYVTVQAKRPINFFRDGKNSGLPSNWTVDDSKHTNFITGELFNNALAGGLPVHYSIAGKPSDVLSNQVNYNNELYAAIDNELLNLDGAQVFNAVVIPVTEVESEEGSSLPPGAARIYFSALPDAVKDATQSFTLSLEAFPNDPSYDEDNFCNDENLSVCEVLYNTPAGDYQFYTVTNDNAANNAKLTVHNSGEFIPEIVIIDGINGEPVTDDNDSNNPLLIDENGSLVFWVKLGSQPTANVVVMINNQELIFGDNNWYLYQSISIADGNWESSISVTVSSSDGEYNEDLNRTLTPSDNPTRFKIKEAAIPQVSAREVQVGVQATMEDYREGFLDYPIFNVVLSQPLPVAVVANVTSVINSNTKTYKVAIPAWQQVAQVAIPVADDSLVNGDRLLSVTVNSVVDQSDSVLSNIQVSDMHTATVQVKDDEQARILISQHLPDSASKGDMVRLLPEVEILGVSPSGNLQVQQNDSRIKNIVISQVKDGLDDKGGNITQHGLLYELVVNTPGSTGQILESAPSTDFKYIVLPDQPYKAKINDSDDPLTLATIPSHHIVRQRGNIIVDQTGWYTFSYQEQDNQRVELWMNSIDDYSQNKGLIAPYFEDTDHNGIPDEKPVAESKPIALKANTRYYLEALYEAPSTGQFQAVQMNYSFSDVEPNQYPQARTAHNSATPVPLEWLSPATVDGGFVVEVYENIGSESLDAFMQSEAFIQGLPSRMDILTDKLEIPTTDWNTDIGRRITVNITAPESGEYQFALASDGDAKMYLLDVDGKREEISWIKGAEKYGSYSIETKKNDYVGTNVTRTKFNLARSSDGINADTPWEIEYTMAEDTKGTKPFGAHTNVTMFEDMTSNGHICQDDNLTTSDEGTTTTAGAPGVQTNVLYFDGPGGCDFFTDDYDGKSLSLIFLDMPATYTQEHYTNIILDGHPLDKGPDYPGIREWYWDDVAEDEETDGQRNSQQRSALLTFTQGKEYTLEIVQINPRDDDHLSVAWKRPSVETLEIIDATNISFTRFILPVTLLEASDAGVETRSDAIDLRLSASPFLYKGREYQVTSVTLAGDPKGQVEGVTPHQAPGWLEFTSGFSASLVKDSNLTVDNTSNVEITLQDRPTDPAVVSLSVGQTQRIGFQLAGEPADNANIVIDVAIEYPDTATGNSAELGLKCIDGEGDSCKQFTFNSLNWSIPQYVNVTAIAEGPVVNVDYDPSLSKATVRATQRDASGSTDDFDTDAITIQIYPNMALNDTIYFAKSSGEAINSIGFTEDTLDSIKMKDGQGNDLGWFWRLESGKLLGSKIVDGDYGIIISAMSDDEEAGLNITPVPEHADPVTFTAAVELNSQYYTDIGDIGDIRDVVTVSGIQWMINADQQGALGTLVINAGQPGLTLANQLVSSSSEAFSELEYFSYQPKGREPVRAALNEVLVTEFGEITLVNGNPDIKWYFEPNPRPQPQNLSFSLHFSTGEHAPKEIDLSEYNKASALATCMSALPDFSQPRVVLSGFSAVQENADAQTLTVMLKSADGSEVITASENINVYYTVAQLGVTDPGNKALDLAPQPSSDNITLHKARALELTKPVVLQEKNSVRFTLEAWVYPTERDSQQGIFSGLDASGQSIDLLYLSDGQLQAFGGLSAALPSKLAADIGFHIAWQVGDLGQALFVNGEKITQGDILSSGSASLMLTHIGKGKADYLNGLIDEVRVWGEARSDLEIAQNYYTSLVSLSDSGNAGLLGYWAFNDFTLQQAENELLLLNQNGEHIDTSLQVNQQALWKIQRSATVNMDYEGLSSHAQQVQNIFELTPEMTDGKSTFAIGDLNNDQRNDVAIVNRRGELSFMLSTPASKGVVEVKAEHYQRITTDINLGHAAPLALGDIDGDQDLDLVAGLNSGELALLRNISNTANIRAGGGLANSALQFVESQNVEVQHRTLVKSQEEPHIFAPAFVPTSSGKLRLLLTAKNLVLSFDVDTDDQQWQLRQRERDSSPFAQLSLSKRLQQRNITPQYVDLDRDGDQDLILDTLGNLPGQTPGALTYYENFGSDAAPVYFPAPRSHIARFLQQSARYLAPEYRRVNVKYHPFDQVAYSQFADMNNDGFDDILVSDNAGQINLFTSQGYDFVTIPEGSSSADITFNIIDDAYVENTESIVVQLVEGKPEQAQYHYAAGEDRAIIKIEDNDQPGLVLLDATGAEVLTVVKVSETGDATAYQVKLQSQPTREVSLRVASSNPVNGGLLALGSSLEAVPEDSGFTDTIFVQFTANKNDWKIPKVFWIKGIDDQVDDPSAEFVIAVVASSSDIAYDKQAAVLSAVSSDNDDKAVVSLEFTSLPNVDAMGAVVSSEGQVNALTVSLAAQPTAPVMLTLQPTDKELTLFPQRKLVRALTTNDDSQQIRRIDSRSIHREASILGCTLPSNAAGIVTKGDYGNWCWHESGEYQFQQMRYAERNKPLEQLSFMVDNSYGKLSTETISARLSAADVSNKSPAIEVINLLTGEIIGTSASAEQELLHTNNLVLDVQAPVVSFGVRPSSKISGDDSITFTITGTSIEHKFIFTAHDWLQWQRIDDESLDYDSKVSISAIFTGEGGDSIYGEDRNLTVVGKSTPRLVLQDWRMALTKGGAQLADNDDAAVFTDGGGKVILNVRLSVTPEDRVDVSVVEDSSATVSFTKENFQQWQKLVVNADKLDSIQIQSKDHNSNDYASVRSLTVVKQAMGESYGNFFEYAGNLAGDSLSLYFTPDNWQLGQTFTVSAIDDQKVEYTSVSNINVLLANPEQALSGDIGQLRWNFDGTLSYALRPDLHEGLYVEQRFYFTDDDASYNNRSLDITVRVSESMYKGEPTLSYEVLGYVDAPVCVLVDQNCEDMPASISFTQVGNNFESNLDLTANLTGVAQQPLAAAFLARLQDPITVSIEDNDKPVVRAGVDLNASENSHPGYFTLSVLDPVGIPGGLGVHYRVIGVEEGAEFGATAETVPPSGGGLNDPGPDFQAYDVIKQGTLFIPQNKTRVSLPIFPIDDFTPEESLAARYEKVVLIIEPPVGNGDYDGDQYLLDERNPQYKTAGVRIMDNEEVGLKYVFPMQGLTVDEGNFNGFKVGLMSQPQTQVSLDFYNTSVRHENAFDGSFFNVSSVIFDNTNWNQWQTIDVQLYNNQRENYDSKSPRFSDLYFTLLDSSLVCADDPTNPSLCEPFYNNMKGALNMTSPDNDNDGEAKVVEISDVMMTDQESGFGTLTPLKGTDGIFAGDFVYVLSNGDYGSADHSQDMLKAISQSASGEIYDVFDYTMEPLQGSEISQQVAVQIKALERIEFTEVIDQAGISFPAGKFGNLVFNFDGSHGRYTYMFDTAAIEDALEDTEEWRVTDSFVFEMTSGVVGVADGELQQEFVAFNIEVNKYQQDDNGTDKTYYQALINGNPPVACEGAADQTVCVGAGSQRFISGDVTPNTIGGSVADSSVQYKIIKVGRPVLEPVVTRVNLRDSDGADLWAGNQLIHTNPLFDVNSINGADNLVQTGEVLRGDYGQLTLNTDGRFWYQVDLALLNNDLESTDMRQVNDEFVVQLSNHARVAMSFVSTLQVDQNAEKLIVTMNDELLAQDDSNTEKFSGSLLSAEDMLGVVRVGRLPHTIRLREQSLPPQVLAQGLAEALSFIQQRFYDISVPVFGRMGGGPTSDTTGNSAESKAPSFIDRMLSLLIMRMTAQPHLTTEELANLINAVLQASFAQYNVPLQVLKLDSEKLIMRLSYTLGTSIASNELKTDLGMPSMGHFSGSAAGTAKFTADLVFGINFRSVQSGDDGNNKMTPNVFVVTEQAMLDALLGAPQIEPVNIYELKTWESTSVGNSGVLFVNSNGNLLDKQIPAMAPDNIKYINEGLKEHYCSEVWNICPELRWKWLEESQSMNWDLSSRDGVKDFGTLVGYVVNATSESVYGDVIAITLRQPDSIGPNKVTQIQLGVTIDPGNVLASNRQSDSLKKEYIRGVLEYLSSTNTKLTYANEHIRVFDIYSQNYGPNDKSMTAHSSQTMKLGFSVGVLREGSSDPLGYFHPDSYVAKSKITNATPDDNLTADEIIVPVNSTYSDKTKSVTTGCNSATSSEIWKCDTSNSQLVVRASWQQGGSQSELYFPSDRNAFKTKKTYTETVAVAHGKLKIKGRVQGSGTNKTVKWTWKFASLPAKSQNFPPNSNVIDVPVIKVYKQGDSASAEKLSYSITRHMLMFASNQPGDDSEKASAISKLTGELAASIEFRGDMQFFLLGGSINQARRIPTNVDASSIIAPDEVFGRLTGKMNAKSTIVNVEESNTGDAPAYVVGQYGVLAIAKDGSYSYYRKPELELESWDLKCGDYEKLPINPTDASLKAFCKDLLEVDEEGRALYWDDETQAQSKILIKGYQVDNCGSYTDVAAGKAGCTVNNPNVIYVPEDETELTESGVSSLESAIDVELVGLTGWQDTANLVNRKTLKQVWELIKVSDTDGVMYGQTQLVDDFFISVTSDTAFRKLSFELGIDNGIQAIFNDVPFDGLAPDTVSYPDDDALEAKGWAGGRINYHEFGFGEILQASSLAIQPMAEANIYLSVALRDPRTAHQTDGVEGLVYLTDFTNPKDLVSYSLGGNAALYAKINAGIDTNLYKETDDDEQYQGFSIPGPSVSTNIGLVANYQFEGSFSDVSSHGGEFMFGAFNLELDIGEFISDKLVEPLGAMSSFLDPVQPIANALTADMKIFQSLNLTDVFDANYDGKITILEVPTPFMRSSGPKAERFQKQLKSVSRFLEFISGMAQMIKIAGELGDELSGAQALDERIISLDGYQLSPESIRIVPYQTSSDFTNIDLSLVPYVNQLGHIVLGIDKNYQYIKTLGGTLTSSTVKPMNPVKPRPGKPSTQKNTSMGKVKSRYADLQQRGVVSFPILSNPLDILKFVFGDPADLMLIDTPDFNFDFEVEKGWRPPPAPIFKGKISGQLQIISDTMIGIDTAGLLSAVCGSDAPGPVWDCQGELSAGERSIRLLNSVFLRDWNDQSYYAGGDTSANKVFWKGSERQLPGITVWDKHELAGNAEVDIGAGIDLGVFGAFFQGGPGIGGGIDVVDLCEPSTPDLCDPIQNGDFTAGGVYDGKIRAYDFVMQMINDPMSTFDIGFTFYVDFEAYVETFKVKIWEELIGYFPLFEFDKDGAHWAGGAKSSSGVSLAGAILYFDANNNQLLDPGEPMTFTDAKGLASLHIPYHLYDRNRDGRISNQDGTIRHFGGINVKTGLGQIQQVGFR